MKNSRNGLRSGDPETKPKLLFFTGLLQFLYSILFIKPMILYIALCLSILAGFDMVLLSKIINMEIQHNCHNIERFALFMLKLSSLLQEQGVSPDDVAKIIHHYSILFRKLFVDNYDPETPPYFLQQ